MLENLLMEIQHIFYSLLVSHKKGPGGELSICKKKIRPVNLAA